MIRVGAVLLLFAAAAAADDLAPKLRAGLVRLYVTSQSYDAREPWKKRSNRSRVGRGVVVAPGVVLTPASNVRDARMIEVAIANSARRYPARLKHVDARIGLAQVEITDPTLRDALRPLPVGPPIKLDDECDIHQLGTDNILERYTARVVSASASTTRLTLRVKTTCSDSGDGQIALKDGHIAGLLVSTSRSRQEGTILGVETLRHYLDDFTDGVYNGCGASGLWIQPLLRADLRLYYGLADDQHGIAIRRVMQGRTGHGVLKEDDVLLTVDGYALDDEGKFVHEVHGRLGASYLFQGRRYAGDTIKAKILRAGKVQEVSFELRPHPLGEQRVPSRAPGARPAYLVVGGLVVLELDGAQSLGRSGVVLRRYRERAGWDQPGARRRIVYVSHVLADPANKGYDDVRRAPILTVNGKPIHEIADVARALEAPQGKFHVFTLEGVEADIVLPAKDLPAIDGRIAKTYKVTRLRWLAGDEE